MAAVFFTSCLPGDFTAIANFCHQNYLVLEPYSNTLLYTQLEWEVLIEHLVQLGLKSPFTAKAVDRETGELVGIRLCRPSHRDPSLDKEESPFRNVKPFVQLGKFNHTQVEFWYLADPAIKNIGKVLRVDFFFLRPSHNTEEVARGLADFSGRFDSLRSEGFEGILSETSVLAEPAFLSHGFKCLAVAENFDYHSSRLLEIQVLFKDLRGQAEDTRLLRRRGILARLRQMFRRS